MTFEKDIRDAQRINPNSSGVPLTFHVVPPAGHSFHLLCDISGRPLDRLVQNGGIYPC